jgi:hypothetical protein
MDKTADKWITGIDKHELKEIILWLMTNSKVSLEVRLI